MFKDTRRLWYGIGVVAIIVVLGVLAYQSGLTGELTGKLMPFKEEVGLRKAVPTEEPVAEEPVQVPTELVPVKIISPDQDGETPWVGGTEEKIIWKYGIAGEYLADIWLVKDEISTLIAKNVEGNSYSWEVPSAGGFYRISIVVTKEVKVGSDVSDNPFEIIVLEKQPVDLVREAFAKKYNEPLSKIKVDADMETDRHMRGTVRIGVGPGSAGLFLAAKVDGQWTIVHDGHGVFTCDDVAPYGFPKCMVSDCYSG